MKTSELTGAALDWAVAKCEGVEIILRQENWDWYSSSWEQGGPIIERERISIGFDTWDEVDAALPIWYADNYMKDRTETGPTPLIAAMRCYVASKLGDDVEVPNELLVKRKKHANERS
jgi:hypothetical protein